jgi:uncharacterized NAD(P)/FAD-binding protein YdhS
MRKMVQQVHDVAVVGAGATGVALVVQLVRSLPAGSRVLLVGSAGETARGVAYGTALPLHLLNVRAGRMSAIHDDCDHFVRWLAAARWSGGDEDEIAETYAPRTVYGSYLLDTLHREIAAARGRVRVDVVEDRVADLAFGDGFYALRTEDGTGARAAAVAFCLGHGAPAFPIPSEAVDPAARGRMIADPWADRRLEAIDAEARVMIVGTGLTMVDQVLTLAARGHRGPVTAVSRRGFLPAPHLLRRTEPETIDIPDGPLALRALVRAVAAAARSADAAGGDWRAVVDGLRPVTQEIWQRLGPADRRRFCRHVECIWSVVRHRMAPEIASRLAGFREAGRLDIRAGRIVAVRGTGRSLAVGIRARGESTVSLHAFDWMINCSGVGRVPVNAVEAPLGPLVAAGLLRGDPLGRGVEVTALGAAVGRSGSPSPGLYALGPLGAGSLMEITAMPDIREQCATVAATIAAHARRGSGRSSGSGRVVAGLAG